MTILDEIVTNKRKELQNLEDFETLDDRIRDLTQAEILPLTKSFLKTIRDCEGPALIAELKKASPSKGVIKEDFDVCEIARQYANGGAHCFSVLTDSKYFQGSFENLIVVSGEFPNPCLCKEFIIDERQIAQARLSGADAILLIATILNDVQLEDFKFLANEYAMDVLLEVHNEEEMERALRLDFDMIGINNRDLSTLEVSLDTSSQLISKFKFELAAKVLISESGIATKQDIMALHGMGVKGFLVGESLIKQDDIRSAVEALIF